MGLKRKVNKKAENFQKSKKPNGKERKSVKGKVILERSNDPKYRRPFAKGWKREIVFRKNAKNANTSKTCDVYYYSPTGKKCRALTEISSQLSPGLTVDNFTFSRCLVAPENSSSEVQRKADDLKKSSQQKKSRYKTSKSAKQVVALPRVRNSQKIDTTRNTTSSIENGRSRSAKIDKNTTRNTTSSIENGRSRSAKIDKRKNRLSEGNRFWTKVSESKRSSNVTAGVTQKLRPCRHQTSDGKCLSDLDVRSSDSETENDTSPLRTGRTLVRKRPPKSKESNSSKVTEGGTKEPKASANSTSDEKRLYNPDGSSSDSEIEFFAVPTANNNSGLVKPDVSSLSTPDVVECRTMKDEPPDHKFFAVPTANNNSGLVKPDVSSPSTPDVLECRTMKDEPPDHSEDSKEKLRQLIMSAAGIINKNLFQCYHCGYDSGSKRILKAHMSRHTSESSAFSCKTCGHRAPKYSKLLTHLKIHTEVRPFECYHCDFKAKHIIPLKRHIQAHLGINRFACAKCEYRTNSSYTLKMHVLLHSSKSRFACKHCNYRCSKSLLMKKHQRVHLREKRYSCEYCSYRTKYSRVLRDHRYIHQDVKPYHCSICSYRGTTSKALESHMRSHTGEKPFKCKHCDFRTGYRSVLRKHLKGHKGVFNLTCPYCSYKTQYQTNIKRHVMLHENDKPHCCPHCDSRFIGIEELNNHMRIHTGEKPFMCNFCSYRSSYLTSMKTHLKKCNPVSYKKMKEATKKKHVEILCSEDEETSDSFIPTPKTQSMVCGPTQKKKMKNLKTMSVKKLNNEFEKTIKSFSQTLSDSTVQQKMNNVKKKRVRKLCSEDEETCDSILPTLKKQSVIRDHRSNKKVSNPKKKDVKRLLYSEDDETSDSFLPTENNRPSVSDTILNKMMNNVGMKRDERLYSEDEESVDLDRISVDSLSADEGLIRSSSAEGFVEFSQVSEPVKKKKNGQRSAATSVSIKPVITNNEITGDTYQIKRNQVRCEYSFFDDDMCIGEY